MKAQNLVNELFKSANRPEQGDNRSHIVKTLNKVLEDGIVKVAISEKGKAWTNKNYVDANGNKINFNIEIKGYGRVRRAYVTPYIDADDVLKQVGKFLQDPIVSEKHTAAINVSGFEVCECERCNGKGIIPAFHYYCQGICFECYGSKYIVRKYTLSV
jgi:hypothetical protein